MPDAHPSCPDHGATARNDGTCMVRGCRYGQRVTSPAVGRVCPECQQGKHQNCDGTAWDDVADAPGPCSCTDGSHR